MDKALTYSPPAPGEVLRFQLHRLITDLFKGYLILLEDVSDSHDESMNKLRAALPETSRPFVDLADYLTPERCQLLRKRILDAGNDSKRAVDVLLESFEVSLKR